MRVLVIDDSAFMRRLIARAIDGAPGLCAVGTARNGHEGLDMIRLLGPDLVTLDMDMPGLDGPSTLRRILETWGDRAPGVLICSGRTDPPLREYAAEAGPARIGFLLKDPASLGPDNHAFRDALILRLTRIGAARPPHRVSAPPDPVVYGPAMALRDTPHADPASASLSEPVRPVKPPRNAQKRNRTPFIAPRCRCLRGPPRPPEPPTMNAIDNHHHTAPGSRPTRHLRCDVGGRSYAIDIGRVREIVRVPATHRGGSGTVTVRGHAFPVLDLRDFFGVGRAECSDGQRIIIVAAGDDAAGLLVDRVHELCPAGHHAAARPARTPCGLETTDHHADPIPLLDLDAALRSLSASSTITPPAARHRAA